MSCNPRAQLCLTIVCSVLLLLPNDALAAKGGNGGGGGKPGEDPPPPTAPVTYSVTPITIPGISTAFYGHNEAGAMVGSLYDAPPGGRRGLAYLPGITSGAVYLDNPNFNLQGIPTGWHTRSAVDINIHGTIVGNMDQVASPNTDVRPMYITGAMSGTPTLHTFATPFHPSAWHEVVTSINDSGDMLVWSEEQLADESRINRLYLGNPGLHGEAAVPFSEIDFSSRGLVQPVFSNTDLHLTNRRDGAPALIVGEFWDQGEHYTFRTSPDLNDFHIAPNYIAEDGSHQYWDLNFGGLDINASGDVTGGAVAEPARNGKIKRNLYAGLWELGSDEILPVGDFDPFQSDWWGASLNDDGDFLLQAGQSIVDALWHAEWSQTNGELPIGSLIDPNDPNAYLYTNMELDLNTYNTFDLTNRNADGWPTILARGLEELADGTNQPYWLILTPQATTAVSTTTIPEPQTAILLAFAALSSLSTRRKSDRGSIR